MFFTYILINLLTSLEKLERLFIAAYGLSPATTEVEDNGYPAPGGFTVIGAVLAACESELPPDVNIHVLGYPRLLHSDIKLMIDFSLFVDNTPVEPGSVIYYTMELPGSLPSNRIILTPSESVDLETKIPFVPLAGNKIRFAFAADEFPGVRVYLQPAPSTSGGGDTRSELTFPNLHVVGDEPEPALAPAEIPNPSTGGGSPVPMASMAVLLAVLAGAGAWMKRGR